MPANVRIEIHAEGVYVDKASPILPFAGSGQGGMVSQARRAESTVTPEAVRLRVDVAGLGSRTIALLLDSLIQAAILIPVLVVFLSGGVAGTVESVVFAVVLFGVLWLYYPAFEWLWSGRTPGKRAQRIRVIRTDGQPVGFAPVAVRNLIRIVEVFLLPFLAVISMVVTARAQRLGDLAAGTLVIRERPIPAPQPLDLADQGGELVPGLDTSRLTEREYGLIRSFLARRGSLDPVARRELAARLVASIRGRLGEQFADARLPDEQLLEAVARSYRARFTREDR
jgi:uncharacterized RDD family membrane protein YckC